MRWLRENGGFLLFVGFMFALMLMAYLIMGAVDAECAASYAKTGVLCN